MEQMRQQSDYFKSMFELKSMEVNRMAKKLYSMQRESKKSYIYQNSESPSSRRIEELSEDIEDDYSPRQTRTTRESKSSMSKHSQMLAVNKELKSISNAQEMSIPDVLQLVHKILEKSCMRRNSYLNQESSLQIDVEECGFDKFCQTYDDRGCSTPDYSRLE